MTDSILLITGRKRSCMSQIIKTARAGSKRFIFFKTLFKAFVLATGRFKIFMERIPMSVAPMMKQTNHHLRQLLRIICKNVKLYTPMINNGM